jgi:hypothetical protein
MNLLRLKLVLFCLGLCLFAASGVNGQAPAASRGLQLLPITQDDCFKRARQALEGEGYTLWGPPGPDYYFAYKQNHTAVVMCNPAPEGKTWANVVVATAGTGDGNIPGAERVRIQERLSPPDRPATTTTWKTQPNELGTDVGTRFTLTCPANGELSGRLWGTDIYTNDSSVCTAAVHAGLITVDRGGVITIELRAGLSSYKGSIRNGATSADYGSWSGSFIFLR